MDVVRKAVTFKVRFVGAEPDGRGEGTAVVTALVTPYREIRGKRETSFLPLIYVQLKNGEQE